MQKKAVKNWILADKNYIDVEHFVLITDRKSVTDVFADLDVDEIFKEVNVAAGYKAIEAKIKVIGYTEVELKQKIRDIELRASVKNMRIWIRRWKINSMILTGGFQNET